MLKYVKKLNYEIVSMLKALARYHWKFRCLWLTSSACNSRSNNNI